MWLQTEKRADGNISPSARIVYFCFGMAVAAEKKRCMQRVFQDSDEAASSSRLA